MNPAAPASVERVVVCPGCGGPSVYGPSNPFRPFCGERCKQIDLGAWASESFRVAQRDDDSDRNSDLEPHD